MPLEENVLIVELRWRARREEGPKEYGIPSRWWDANVRRCANEHVSTRFLKSEEHGRLECLVCRAEVHLTFPEDVDGPLELTFDPNQAWTEQERATKLVDFITLCPDRPCDDKRADGLAACRECWQMRLVFGPDESGFPTT